MLVGPAGQDVAENWRDGRGLLTGAQVRALCDAPKSQLSMRPARWERPQEALLATRTPDIAAALVISGESQRSRTRRGRLAGGHRIGKTRTRVGQQAFRERLLDEQGENCAFTGPAPACVLDAAHLCSYADSGEHHEFGGLLLRRDIHRLFDLGRITVDPDTGELDVVGLDDYPLYAGLRGAPVFADLHDEHRVWLDVHRAEHRGQA
ncbi:HNH endonuclease signature motif containing protein [Streptomyces sp. SDr-06]|uniref:HNH endonuclease signature motif containing protein n=1 Tax=Streptomyces sp. SDr-06 TaxID=2267702 RepID=UPI00167C0610|nr:HNH endonuclease signature motif containing protein [Streptomyces sp. SDr-06]